MSTDDKSVTAIQAVETAKMAAEDKKAPVPKQLRPIQKVRLMAWEATHGRPTGAKTTLAKHVKPPSDEDEEEGSEKENDEPPKPLPKKKAAPAPKIPPKRKQCTYIGGHGIPCARFPTNPDKQGRCCQHGKSVSFRTCIVDDCTNWTRNPQFVCAKCKMRSVSAAKHTESMEKKKLGIEYVNSLAELDDETKATILNYFGATPTTSDEESAQ